ncbi:MAG: sigma-54-dependent Fis family transcriptional regulator [Bacillota bacterium]|nr:sigma-54-dependent Fis family transcriptional regulator [Bacillota bacterium]
MINSELLNSIIAKSHKRCIDLGISKNLVYSRRILDEAELQKRFAKNRNLIITVLPYMNQLINFVKDSDFFALLTDEEGCILNAIGDEKILSEAFALKMVPGAFMDEKSIGTNAMSMVITEKQPIQISGRYHFIEAYHKWTCSAAPIMCDGKLIGVLNLTGYTENVHPHTLGMVVAASNAIEEILKVKEFNKEKIKNSSHINRIFESIPVGIITSDINGKIKTYNKKAVQMFGSEDNPLNNKNMLNIICDWEKLKNEIYFNKSIPKQVSILSLRGKYICNFKAGTIYNSDDNEAEIIYIFEETDQKKSEKVHGRAYYTFERIVGEDENFLKIIQYAKKISKSKSTILIMGESGTGKEVFAQSIHNYSDRVDGPFIAINCGAIPKQLIESEFFGYEEGAFTGAKKGGNLGKFELVSGGTIMLDEIGEMPLDMQTKLLRVVQEGVITRIGSSKSINVDVRIIAATNKDLKKEVELGRFRKDLYYRLNVLPIYLPPLRERKTDIPLLINFFMNSISKKLDKEPVNIPREYLNKMINYPWAGNIRELENVVELIINTESIPSMFFGEETSTEEEALIDFNNDSYKLDYIEEQHIIKTLKKFKGNITNTADALGIRRNTLYCKIKKYNILIKE